MIQTGSHYINSVGEIVKIVDYNRYLDWPYIDENDVTYKEDGSALSGSDIVCSLIDMHYKILPYIEGMKK